LTSDLDLTDHLRFETRDNGEKMFDGLQAWYRTEMLIKRGRGRTSGLE
jgi:hypothetical protein